MNRDNDKAFILALIGVLTISIYSSKIDDRLREIKNSAVSTSVDVYNINKTLDELGLDDYHKDILEKYIESLDNEESIQYGLYDIDVLTITNKIGEKKSYLVTESSFEERDNDGRTYDDFSFVPYEKYFEDVPSFFVRRVEKVIYSRVGSDGESPFIFKTTVFAAKNDTYRGQYIKISSMFGNYESRSVFFNIVDNDFIIDTDYSYEKVDSEFDIKVEPLYEVLGVTDSSLSFDLEELCDIEQMINDRNSLTLS